MPFECKTPNITRTRERSLVNAMHASECTGAWNCVAGRLRFVRVGRTSGLIPFHLPAPCAVPVPANRCEALAGGEITAEKKLAHTHTRMFVGTRTHTHGTHAHTNAHKFIV